MEQQTVCTTYRVVVSFSKGNNYTHTSVASVSEKSFGRIEITLSNGERYRYAHVISYAMTEENHD